MGHGEGNSEEPSDEWKLVKDRTGLTSQLIRFQMVIECETEFLTSQDFANPESGSLVQ